MSKAKELAKEIADALCSHTSIDEPELSVVERIIAAKLGQYAIFDKPTGSIPQISSWSG